MFAGLRTSATPIWLFVVFNSFIHSIMYCESDLAGTQPSRIRRLTLRLSLLPGYYAMKSLKLPFPQVLKKNITRMQITQFLVGGALLAFSLRLWLRLSLKPRDRLSLKLRHPVPCSLSC
jgi:hypothetical protein